jgi:hypothetical protein
VSRACTLTKGPWTAEAFKVEHLARVWLVRRRSQSAATRSSRTGSRPTIRHCGRYSIWEREISAPPINRIAAKDILVQRFGRTVCRKLGQPIRSRRTAILSLRWCPVAPDIRAARTIDSTWYSRDGDPWRALTVPTSHHSRRVHSIGVELAIHQWVDALVELLQQGGLPPVARLGDGASRTVRFARPPGESRSS